MPSCFITGTDTDSGKTLVTLALMHALQQQGLTVNAMKPVAAGAGPVGGGSYNEDAFMLQQLASVASDYHKINPYLFEPAIAPHIAAQQKNITIDMDIIKTAFVELQQQADITLVEGAGGWLVPLSQTLDISDIPLALDLPVILVVGLKLGCINHARLSLQAIRAAGCRVSGWIGSQVDAGMSCVDENVLTLKHYLDVPCLGIIPHLQQADGEQAAQYLQVTPLVEQE